MRNPLTVLGLMILGASSFIVLSQDPRYAEAVFSSCYFSFEDTMLNSPCNQGWVVMDNLSCNPDCVGCSLSGGFFYGCNNGSVAVLTECWCDECNRVALTGPDAAFYTPPILDCPEDNGSCVYSVQVDVLRIGVPPCQAYVKKCLCDPC